MDLGKTFMAIANLGVRFWIHIFKYPFVNRKAIGLPRFDENYKADGLARFEPVTYGRMPVYEGCLNCGACDAACEEARAQGLGLWKAKEQIGPIGPIGPIQPSLLACDVSRSQPQYAWGIDLAEKIRTCAECRLCEKACPNRVPILELAGLVVEKAIPPVRALEKVN